ncbi:hypothetical protein GQ55_3G296900 [Panicum hallii var. hallii]|uniref:C2 domain-containing protein n=1 Tax=Panicum hallii var. hallii TaxID=1504633 RepID=A0A2T7EEP3_9POAL|nr:hypothetical protein GQ55_3G296900 [Panicum hallii var. hallii]
MACRTLELTLVSARDLRAVNLVSKMEVYAVAYLAGDPRSRQRVATDHAGGRDPTWNQTVHITVPASGAGSGAVRVLLRTERALGSDRDVGEVLLPLPDVLAGAGDGPTEAAAACFPVRRVGSSKRHGVLNVSYKLGGVVCPDLVTRAEGAPPVQAGDPSSPMMAYLAAAAKAYAAARPPQCLPPTPYPVAPMGTACASMRSKW